MLVTKATLMTNIMVHAHRAAWEMYTRDSTCLTRFDLAGGTPIIQQPSVVLPAAPGRQLARESGKKGAGSGWRVGGGIEQRTPLARRTPVQVGQGKGDQGLKKAGHGGWYTGWRRVIIC